MVKLTGRALKCFEKHKDYAYCGPDELKEIIEALVDEDPSTNNKYLDWMVKQLLDDEGLNHCDLLEQVSYFHNNLSKFETKDIYSFKKYTDFIHAYNLALQKLSKQDKKEHINKTSVILHEDNDYLIVVPLSWEASKHWGNETKWCTTMKEYQGHYENYMTKGYLYYIIDKLRVDKDHPLSKVAAYVSGTQTIQMFNRPDSGIGSQIRAFFPEYVHDLIMKHYDKHSYDMDSILEIVFSILNKKSVKTIRQTGEVITYFEYPISPNHRIRMNVRERNKNIDIILDLIDRGNHTLISRQYTFTSDNVFKLTKTLFADVEEAKKDMRDVLLTHFKTFKNRILPVPYNKEFSSEVSRINTSNKFKDWVINSEKQDKDKFKELFESKEDELEVYFEQSINLKHKGKNVFSKKQFTIDVGYDHVFQLMTFDVNSYCDSYYDYVGYRWDRKNFDVDCSKVEGDLSKQINFGLNEGIRLAIQHFKTNGIKPKPKPKESVTAGDGFRIKNLDSAAIGQYVDYIKYLDYDGNMYYEIKDLYDK